MITRRQFFMTAMGSFAGMGLLLTPVLSVVRRGVAKTRKIIIPKGTKRENLVGKNPGELDTRNLEITPLKDFGTMGPTEHGVDLDFWRLEIDGHTKRARKLTYSQVTSLPSIEREVLLICPGFFANYGRWKGVSIKELMEEAGWKRDATHVTLRGPKSDYEKVERYPIADVLSEKVFLAYQVNGEILPMRHGFPLRLVAEGHYGYEWIKYVYRVTVERIVGD